MTKPEVSLQTATVLAAYGRRFWLAPQNHAPMSAMTRGRHQDVVTGDQVHYTLLGTDAAVIEKVLPRRSVLQRSDQRRSKTIAANLDQIAIVLSGQPLFSEELLVRVLIAAEHQKIGCALIATKADVPGAMERIAPRLAVYEQLGYPVYRIAAEAHPDKAITTLMPWIGHRTALLLGQSGMGKSTLVNLLVPEAALATQSISEALQTGRHTTTFTRAFHVATGGRLIDSPGFQLFGLDHLSMSEIEHGMREFQPFLGECRFHNCSHRHEPGCAIHEAVSRGLVDRRRHALYEQIRTAAQA
jgi:ribosome biogenesis GTPase